MFSGESTSDQAPGLVEKIQKSDIGRLDGSVNFIKPRLCSNPVDKTCGSDTRTFASDTKEIWFSSDFSGIKEDQKVVFSWLYISGDLDVEKPHTISEVEVVVKKDFNELNTNMTKPTAGWPVGEYKISVSIDGVNKEFLAQRFSIK